MNIEGYRPVRHNHPSNVRRGSLCTYFRESVHVSLPQSLPHSVFEWCLNFKVC